MSDDTKKAIAKICNKTNFKLLSWYMNPRESAQAGLKRVKLAFKMSMHTTGKENFSCFTYFKTELYDPENPWSDEESECEDFSDSEDSEESHD